MASWLDQVIEYSKYSESPERHFWWSGLAVISAIARKNVWLDRFYYTLYPNIYVIIVSAKSGLRKGVPLSLANSLLSSLQEIRVVGGQNSIQAIIRDLSKQKTTESGQIFSDAQAILIAPEFRDFLINDDSALTTLTNLHDTHAHFEAFTKSLKGTSEPEVLKNPCISLLAASNETLLGEIIKNTDMEGGFVARSFIVYESKRRLINSLVDKPPMTLSKGDLLPYLQELLKVKGEFKWTDKSKALYDRWYTKICGMEVEDKTGSLERIGDQVLKAAMLIALANDFSLELKSRFIQEAIDRSEECILGTNKVSMGKGKSDIAENTARILKILIGQPGQEISRKLLLSKIYTDTDALTLDRIVDTLVQSGAIEPPILRSMGNGRTEQIYKMKEEVYEKYVKFKGE